VTLLGGCSIWPKALTWGSDPLPAQEQPVQPTVAAAPVPAAAAPAPVEPKPEVTATAVTTPAQVEPLPPAKVQAQTLPPAPQIVMAPPPRTAPATGLVHGFYINVGLFAVPGNGRNAYQKLEAAGLPVFSDGIQSKKGPLTRVRVGPFTTRAQADAAAKKIQALQLAAVVFRH
jgi:cell division septation protein DedD